MLLRRSGRAEPERVGADRRDRLDDPAQRPGVGREPAGVWQRRMMAQPADRTPCCRNGATVSASHHKGARPSYNRDMLTGWHHDVPVPRRTVRLAYVVLIALAGLPFVFVVSGWWWLLPVVWWALAAWIAVAAFARRRRRHDI
jgi:hypothetical protein